MPGPTLDVHVVAGAGVGVGVTTGVAAVARSERSAASESIRPLPVFVSMPGGPTSFAVLTMAVRSWVTVALGTLDTRSAARPATCGVAIDVPEKSAYPGSVLGSVVGYVDRMATPGALTATFTPAVEKFAG